MISCVGCGGKPAVSLSRLALFSCFDLFHDFDLHSQNQKQNKPRCNDDPLSTPTPTTTNFTDTQQHPTGHQSRVFESM